jgi:transcription elongation factor Elf1
MRIKSRRPEGASFTCPFCKETIKASSKTEINYRNKWFKGCYNCFALSIGEITTLTFQKKNYEISGI